MTYVFRVGDRVRLATRPPYFKTTDPMPMLRPPDLVPVGEVGQ
ncbi:MAG: NAD(P)H dehydrogenase assembly family protein, partial [Cyanobacteria bacterium P01_H01_bin.121]